MGIRVGIDAHILGKKKGGVETYIYYLIKNLARLDDKTEYLIYVGDDQPFREGELPSNFSLVRLPVVNPWIQRSLVLPYVCARDRLDVIHCQRVLPLWGCGNSVLHIHDAQYVTSPHMFPLVKRTILNIISRRSGKRAAKVLTGTVASRDEIVRAYGIDPAKIVMIPPGVDLSSFFPVTDRGLVGRVREKFNTGDRYVIYLGAIERNKNIHRLIEAFSIFRKKATGFRLVIAGRPRGETRGGYDRELADLADELGCGEDVIFTGYISAEDRRLLLNGASMLAFPSLAEGFGLPPLEAMACGIPAIITDIPVMKEVYGEAALMVEPDDAEGLAEMMGRVATDPELAGRLVESGFEKARQYSWEGVARKMIDLYHSVGMDKNSRE